MRERENKRSKTKRTTTHSDMIAFFLSSLLGFCNTSLCPYVFISHSTRCYDVRVGNFSCKNLIITASFLSLSLTKKKIRVSASLQKKKKKRIVCDLFSVVYCFPLNNEYTRHTYSKEFLKRMNDDREEEEENGDENCAALVIEEIEREIERAKKQTFSSSHVVHSVTPRFGSDQEEEDKTNKMKKKEEDENNNENKNREERNRARREAVEWRRKKIEEKTFDPRAAFRERVKKKKKNKNDENDETIGGDENDKWQSPSVVMRRRREKNVTVSTRKKSWTELETEWKLFEEKWKDSRGDDENENENENEKQRRRVLRFQDVPFPSSGAGLLTFLISNRGPFSEDENGRKKAKRELAKRWHPDKFAQKFSRLLKDEDKEDVMEMVKEIYQSGTALMNTLSWDG